MCFATAPRGCFASRSHDGKNSAASAVPCLQPRWSPPMTRRAGVLIPLFSIASSRSWGIGEIGDIEPITRWLESAGQRILQLLPINEMPPGESSPYSALSAMAIDPQFITLDHVEDFSELGGEDALAPSERSRIDAVRRAPLIQYADVRELKHSVLRRCLARFT